MRVYVDGVFDLFHYGHADMLRRVKEHFGPSAVICVGVCSDADCKKYKRRPLLNQQERIHSVSMCKYVDEVVSDAPWIIDEEFLKKYEIDVVCHDGTPYAAPGTNDVYEYVKSVGKFVHIPRTEGISTSNIIHRVLLIEGHIGCEK